MVEISGALYGASHDHTVVVSRRKIPQISQIKSCYLLGKSHIVKGSKFLYFFFFATCGSLACACASQYTGVSSRSSPIRDSILRPRAAHSNIPSRYKLPLLCLQHTVLWFLRQKSARSLPHSVECDKQLAETRRRIACFRIEGGKKNKGGGCVTDPLGSTVLLHKCYAASVSTVSREEPPSLFIIPSFFFSFRARRDSSYSFVYRNIYHGVYTTV